MLKTKVTHWPVEDGRYKVGNPSCPVAICTEATVEGINIDLNKIAIIGKCVTENIGIEKVVKNIVSNPNIRFLILCGKKSHGHDVGQTIISLNKNGIDNKMKVIGSTGSIPVVKHLTAEEINCFRKQILTIDLQGETSENKISFKVEECLKQDPGAFTGKPMKINKLKEGNLIKCVDAVVSGKFISDPTGSFQISIDKKEKLIICRHHNKNLELDIQINGKDSKSICETLIRMGLVGNFKDSLGHASYLGRELMKAEIALENEIAYTQDKSLEIKNSELRIKNDKKDDEFGW
ncbi:MAG: hypothetical protein V1858_05500 [Candidatus Gottesmanbacteria bacterium]